VLLTTLVGPQIRGERRDSYAIGLSENSIANYIRRYQAMLATRQQDFEALRRHYHGVDDIILSIDGLQPEKGHETLYVVRELTQKRVWFARPVRYSDRPPPGGDRGGGALSPPTRPRRGRRWSTETFADRASVPFGSCLNRIVHNPRFEIWYFCLILDIMITRIFIES
jgi:hypothetical protein